MNHIEEGSQPVVDIRLPQEDGLQDEAWFADTGYDAAKRKWWPPFKKEETGTGPFVPPTPQQLPRENKWDIRRHMPRPERPMKKKPKANR